MIHRDSRPPSVRADERVEFLVIDYQSRNPKTRQLTDVQVKFPGGGMKYIHESPAQTMAREVFEETSLCVYDWKEMEPRKMSATHTQYGFLVSSDHCKGYLRTEPMVDDDGDLLSPPYWVKASTLGRVIFSSHREHYLAACRELRITPTADPNHTP